MPSEGSSHGRQAFQGHLLFYPWTFSSCLSSCLPIDTTWVSFSHHDVSALLQAEKSMELGGSKNWNIGSSEPKQIIPPLKLFFHSNRKWLALSFLITPPGELLFRDVSLAAKWWTTTSTSNVVPLSALRVAQHLLRPWSSCWSVKHDHILPHYQSMDNS